MLVTVVVLAAVAKPLPDVARDEGFAAVADQVAAIAASTSEAKVGKALAALQFGDLALPVFLVFGADLSLADVTPLERCVWVGGVTCLFDAKGVGKPEDYVPVCKGSYGQTVALDATAVDAGEGRIGWRVVGVEACWKLGAVGIKVMPRPDRSLDGIGAGDDLIPPELSQLTQAEVFAEIKARSGEFGYCAKKYPGARGSMVIAFHIADDGSVGTATIKSSTFDHAEVQTCLVDRLKRIRFTPPMGGYQDAEYPMTLL